MIFHTSMNTKVYVIDFIPEKIPIESKENNDQTEAYFRYFEKNKLKNDINLYRFTVHLFYHYLFLYFHLLLG